LRLRDIFGGPPKGGESTRDDARLRKIVLAGQEIDYQLIRARRRTIGMQIDFSGLTVRAPRWVSIREIESTLTERDAWIVRSIAEWQARRRDVLPRTWKTGALIVYLGRELTLAVHPARKREIAVDLINSPCFIRPPTTSARSRRSSPAGCATRPSACSRRASWSSRRESPASCRRPSCRTPAPNGVAATRTADPAQLAARSAAA
jgi:hypothetical protein